MLPTETKQLLAGPASYNISNSLRFRASASAYLNRTFVAGNTKKYTFSAWVKRGTIGAIDQGLIWASSGNNVSEQTGFYFSSDTIRFFNVVGGTTNTNMITTQVFRDCSAWYHILFIFDSANATSTDRYQLWINGVRVTAFSTATYPPLNQDTYMNNAFPHTIARDSKSAASFLDGYMAEVNFIDGQALTAPSFGFYDPYTGVWMPRRYTGTYTGNSFYLPFINQPSSTFAATFNGSTQYLTTNAFAASTNLSLSNSDFTVEYWMNTTTATNGTTLCCAGSGTASFDGLFGYIATGALVLYLSSTGSSWDIASALNVISSITTGRWYHIAISRSGSTWRIFVDGTQVNTITSSASLYQSANQFTLGRAQSTGYFTGLLSNVRVVKGTALYTSNFLPSIQPLTAVTNTQLLTLQSSTVIDNSANNIPIINTGSVAMSAATPFTQPDLTADYSGLGNNWTPNNISLTAGITYDSMIDVPTNWVDGGNGRGNYCVLNFLDKYSTNVLSNANLSTNGLGLARTTFGMSSGKWYWEAIAQSTACINGVVTANANIAQYVGQNAFGWGYYGSNGNKYNNGTNSAYGATYTTNDVIGVAFDADNGTLVFYKNGVSQGTAYTGLTSGPYFASCSDNGATAQAMSYNFGQRPFFYSNYGIDRPAATFLALNTQNLVTPTILNGARYMAATTYTGTSATNRIYNSANNTLGVTFTPDLVWIKNRNYAPGTNHVLIDSVRGDSLGLSSNLTSADFSTTGNFSGIKIDGFTVTGTTRDYNFLSDTFIGWQWNAGTGSSTIPSGGSITPTGASINVSAGFSVITYTGNGVSNASIAHGLGATPLFLITKCRSSATDWVVNTTATGSAIYLFLDTTAAGAADTGVTPPTSTLFYRGGANTVNGNGLTYVTYLWTPIAGYSSFGSYTANASTDGPMVFTNMRPRFVLIKNTTRVLDWIIYDSSRDLYNTETQQLYPNLSSAEAAGANIDFLSNGFKIRAGSGSGINNTSGDVYVYAAFAENPFKVSRAR